MTCSGMAEKYIWENFLTYLTLYPTCLLDNILEIEPGHEQDKDPMTRYTDMPTALQKHIGLQSHVIGQATFFTDAPLVVVGIREVGEEGCRRTVELSFDIIYPVDQPTEVSCKKKFDTAGAVASFKMNINNALDNLMFNADPDVTAGMYPKSFLDYLCGKTLHDPIKDEDFAWDWNVKSSVSEEVSISPTQQLKNEQRGSGLEVWSVDYMLDIHKMWSSDYVCGC